MNGVLTHPPLALPSCAHGPQVYARAALPGGGGGGALAVVNGTWAGFLRQLGRPRHRAGDAQPQHVESLIDQPLMRQVVAELSVREAGKPARAWTVVPGSAVGGLHFYDERARAAHPETPSGLAAACALRDARACTAVAAERSRTPFLAQVVMPRGGGSDGSAGRHGASPAQTNARAERIALAPDWLFGRGCLVHVRSPLTLLQAANAAAQPSATQCVMPPTGPRLAQSAPGPPGVLVATHFVYSMALKRKRSFKAFAWDGADGRNRTAYPPGGSCWRRSQKGILFSHTFFAQTAHKAVLCAMPGGDGPECACCAPVHALDGAAFRPPADQALRMETTSGVPVRWSSARAAKLAQGCGDYQMFWD